MRLMDVARRFDRMSCYDGYTGIYLFNAQLGLFDDTKRDSETGERRIISMSAENVLPARRVLLADGQHFILGKGNQDSYLDEPIRVGYVAHEGTHLAVIRTLGQLARNEAGVPAWGGRSWVKDAAFSEQSSELTPLLHFHFSMSEATVVGQVIEFDGQHHLVRSLNAGASGLRIVAAELMEGTVVESAVFAANGAYNRVTETFTGTSQTVRTIRVRWQALFKYHSRLAPPFGPEDTQLAIAKAIFTPAEGMNLTLSDGAWTLASVDDFGDLWLCRASRHA